MKIMSIPHERVGMELVKMLVGPNPDQAVRSLDELGMLRLMLPELVTLKGMDHGKWHQEGDPFEHTMLVLKNLPKNPSPSLAVAALLHDTGKATTAKPKPDGGVSFHGHEDHSVLVVQAVYARLALGMEEVNGVQVDLNEVIWLVENHMRVRLIPEMKKGKRKELFRDSRFPNLLALTRADDHGKVPFEPAYLEVERLYNEFLSTPDVTPKSRGITGHRVMEVLGMAPGPQVGEVMALFDALLAEYPDMGEDELFHTWNRGNRVQNV